MKTTDNKIRSIIDYDKLSEEIIMQIKQAYPYGYSQHLITFPNREGKQIKGLRFETEEKIYLIRMTVLEAENIIKEDDDYDDDGNLLDEIKEIKGEEDEEYDDKAHDSDDYDDDDDDGDDDDD